MNSVVLIGNLTKDPELRSSTGENQQSICRFTLAVNERKKKNGEWVDDANFIQIVVFGRQAENCDRFLSKGSKCAVNGRIQTGSYVNKEGQKVFTTDIVANNVEFLSRKEERVEKAENASAPAGFSEIDGEIPPWM